MTTPSLAIDLVPGRNLLSTTEVPQGLQDRQPTLEIPVPVSDDDDVTSLTSQSEDQLLDCFCDNMLLYDKRHIDYKNRAK